MNVRIHTPDVEFHILAVMSFDDVSTKVSSDEKVAVFTTSPCPVNVRKHIPFVVRHSFFVVLQIFAVASFDAESATFPF